MDLEASNCEIEIRFVVSHCCRRVWGGHRLSQFMARVVRVFAALVIRQPPLIYLSRDQPRGFGSSLSHFNPSLISSSFQHFRLTSIRVERFCSEAHTSFRAVARAMSRHYT